MKRLCCALAIASLFGCDKPADSSTVAAEVQPAEGAVAPAAQDTAAAAPGGKAFCELWHTRSKELKAAFMGKRDDDQKFAELRQKREAFKDDSFATICTEMAGKELKDYVACVGDSMKAWPKDLAAAMKVKDPSKRDPNIVKMLECGQKHRAQLVGIDARQKEVVTPKYFALLEKEAKKPLKLGFEDDEGNVVVNVPANVENGSEVRENRYGVRDAVDPFNAYAVQFFPKDQKLDDQGLWSLFADSEDGLHKKGDDFKAAPVEGVEGMYSMPYKTSSRQGVVTVLVSKNDQDGMKASCVYEGEAKYAKMALKTCTSVTRGGKAFEFAAL